MRISDWSSDVCSSDLVASLKDPVCAETVAALIAEAGAGIVLNTTAFALSQPGAAVSTPFDAADCPVLQVVLAGTGEDDWRGNANGLSARAIAMNVALPEVDGRLLAGAVSFKDDAGWRSEEHTSELPS